VSFLLARHVMRNGSILLLAMLAVDCGGRAVGQTTATVSSTGSGTGSIMAPGGAGGDLGGASATSTCPANEPTFGTPCDLAPTMSCIYGGCAWLGPNGPASTSPAAFSCGANGAWTYSAAQPDCAPFPPSPGPTSGAYSPSSLVDAGPVDAQFSPTDDANSSADAACDASASLAAICPPFASTCPCGCSAWEPERYDRTQGCLDPPSTEVKFCSHSPAGTAVATCWVRVDTGDAYLFPDTPVEATLLSFPASGSGWRPCTQTDGIPSDGGDYPPLCPTTVVDFVGTWLCADDAGQALSFTSTANGNDLTETFSSPIPGTDGNLTCTEQFAVSGSTATLIPSLTTCTVPQGVQLDGVPSYISQTVSGNTLTYAGEDEGGPLQTVTCARQ
jgi:hypothetical protein